MSQKSKTIVFFGNERLATGTTTTAPTFRALIDAGYTIAALIIKENRPQDSVKTELEVIRIAKDHNIPVHAPAQIRDVTDLLVSLKPDIGVLAAFGRIVPQEILDIFPHGIINIHPSLLPSGRGSTPIESAILAGATKTGVSIMELVKAMDAGPVYGQSEVTLSGNETKQALVDKLTSLGSAMLLELLPAILEGKITPTQQDETAATYTTMIDKADGVIDWAKPASLLEREIRAYSNWPKSRTKLGEVDVVITASEVVQSMVLQPGEFQVNGKDLLVGCGQKSTLSLLSLKPVGKNEMPASSFLAGYQNRIGL